MAKQNNFPTGKLDELPAEFAHETVGSLRELYEKGKPETDEEVEKRINDFFEFCENSSIRPGVESLSMALSVSRTTIWNWERDRVQQSAARVNNESKNLYYGIYRAIVIE